MIVVYERPSGIHTTFRVYDLITSAKKTLVGQTTEDDGIVVAVLSDKQNKFLDSMEKKSIKEQKRGKAGTLLMLQDMVHCAVSNFANISDLKIRHEKKEVKA